MLKILRILKEYWQQILVVGGLLAAFVILPFRVDAMEKRQDKIEEQTTAIYKWVEQAEKEKEFEKERIATAPPGYRWDSSKKEYVSA